MSRHQQRIYKASFNNKLGKVHRLQKILTRCSYAKLIAVRQVTTDFVFFNKTLAEQVASLPFKEKRDCLTLISGEQKLMLASRLKLSGSTKSIRQVYIDKSDNKEKQQSKILVIYDKANQALAKMALEPQ